MHTSHIFQSSCRPLAIHLKCILTERLWGNTKPTLSTFLHKWKTLPKKMREKKNQKDPIKLYKQNQLKVASI